MLLRSISNSNFFLVNILIMVIWEQLSWYMAKVSGPRFTSSETTKLSDMFSGCAQITNLDLRYFNTRYVQYMDGMFEDCKKLTKIEIDFPRLSFYLFSFCGRLQRGILYI